MTNYFHLPSSALEILGGVLTPRIWAYPQILDATTFWHAECAWCSQVVQFELSETAARQKAARHQHEHRAEILAGSIRFIPAEKVFVL